MSIGIVTSEFICLNFELNFICKEEYKSRATMKRDCSWVLF